MGLVIPPTSHWASFAVGSLVQSHERSADVTNRATAGSLGLVVQVA